MEFRTRAAMRGHLLQHARVRVAALFPLGIAARLTLSFLAVAALATTANLLAQQGLSVILWSTQDSGTASLPNSADSAPAASGVSVDKKSKAAAIESTIDRLERAAESRSQLNSTANDLEFGAATGALRRNTKDFVDGFSANSPIQKRSEEYIQAAQELVLVSDQRRLERADYSKYSKSANDRVQASLDGAWKIFGRIIARQSLIRLRAELDSVRLHSDSIVAGDAATAKDIEALTASEAGLSAALAGDKSRLIKSEGADWVAQMESECSALIKLRRELILANQRHNQALSSFSQARHLLFATVNEASLAPQSANKPAARPTQFPALTGARAAPAATSTTPEAVPAASTIKNVDHHARDLMAEVTAIVMLLVVLISISTVRSVVAPVRRIVQGSHELAHGQTSVRVMRGGIRELDTLAGAFNDMAARLAAAQETARYQHENLEEKVRERTHKLQILAQQDPLTSLPNRRHLSVLLTDAMERADRDEKFVGVFFLDIDNFKNFNDSLGHVFGDRVLMSVANRLEEITEGLGLVARLGGDEFTVVYEDADSEQSIRNLGSRLVQAFGQLLRVDDRELSVSVSVGASIFPVHARSAEGLLRAADSALFRAKELGRSRAVVFTQEMVESAAARFSIEQGLRRALEHGEFELHYQPEIDLATLEVGMVEALLRWRMPDGRLALPGEFLAIADQSGLINEINKWVMQTAVEAVSRWHHGGWPGARVAINVSPRELLDVRFAESMLALLREFRLPPQAIELELTETVLQTGSTTVDALRALQSCGFGIALDDFGTGYSSLTSLEQLPLSRIKLDRSLIAGIDLSGRSASITRAIIDLCSGLNLQVTAEGVERPAQLAWLLDNRSIWVQGYLLSDAVPFDQVLACRAALVPRTHNLLLSLPVKTAPRITRNPQTKGALTG